MTRALGWLRREANGSWCVTPATGQPEVDAAIGRGANRALQVRKEQRGALGHGAHVSFTWVRVKGTLWAEDLQPFVAAGVPTPPVAPGAMTARAPSLRDVVEGAPASRGQGRERVRVEPTKETPAHVTVGAVAAPAEDPPWRLQGFDPQQRAVLRKGANERRVSPAQLGVADQVLGARSGARFSGEKTPSELAWLAPEVATEGVLATPSIDDNPYNFAAFAGDAPWKGEAPAEATHEVERRGRFSGRIRVTWEAVTPVFVPSAEDPARFYRCWDGAREEFAIPGSTLKGVVRSLVEALTNARAGVTDRVEHDWPPLYRRRAANLYRIRRMPTSGQPGEAIPCRFELVYANGQVHGRGLNPADRAQANVVKPWRRNVFLVPDPRGREVIRYVERGKPVALPWEVYQRFLSMRGHPHLREDHQRNVNDKDPTDRTGYDHTAAPTYEDAASRIFAFDVNSPSGWPGCDLIYALCERGVIRCFGRNVNFLWPAQRSVLDMLGGYAEREAKYGALEGSDAAEILFGFIGDHGADAHPFRGRVRFGAAWRTAGVPFEDALQLMPLTSPPGTKMKSRTLYRDSEERDGSGRLLPSDMDDPRERLRGRKFYWHQRTARPGGVPLQHDQAALTRVPNGPTVQPNIATPPIYPLKAGATFRGEVQFSNLTEAELGALLVALDPNLAFPGKANARHGIKVGKGKPRGLGSLVTREALVELMSDPSSRYASLDAPCHAPPLATARVAYFVGAYKAWCAARSGQAWETLPFVRDLARLLRLPPRPRVRIYPVRFNQYGWMPEFGNARGQPRAASDDGPPLYPAAMKRARDEEP